MLSKLYDVYEIIGNVKYIAYRKAIDSLTISDIILINYKLKKNIPELDEDKQIIINKYKNIKHIGYSIAQKIYEVISSNNIKKLNIYENSEQYLIIKNLTKILFIGPVKAQELYKYGIKNIKDLELHKEDLLKKEILTQNQFTALKYISKLKIIPRDFIKELEESIKLNKKYEWYILGSYARNSQFSKDIDILIIDFDINIILNEIEKKYKLIYVFRQGDKIFSSIFKYKNIYFRLEIFKAEEKSKFTAIQHYTGSKNFNILLRNIAKERNYLLNQYGLYKNGKQILLTSEKELFDILEITYIPPHKRNL